jgi:hypothetical protein
MAPSTALNTALAVLCGPHTGITAEDVIRRAKVRQDHDAGDTLHGHTPSWDDLSARQQEELTARIAKQWWADFQNARPVDPRPVDHFSASSPPWANGADELAHWQAWSRRRTEELTWMAAAQSEGSFVHGRLLEAERWAEQLRLRVQPGDTGSDEVAYWITAMKIRHQELLDNSDQNSDAAQGHVAELGDHLRFFRHRQEHRGAPQFWHYGGRGLLAALGLFEDGHAPLVEDVVVVAAHDAQDQPETVSPLHRNIVRLLRAWTGETQAACEAAIRAAYARGLVDGRTPSTVNITLLEGIRRYRELVEAVTTPAKR